MQLGTRRREAAAWAFTIRALHGALIRSGDSDTGFYERAIIVGLPLAPPTLVPWLSRPDLTIPYLTSADVIFQGCTGPSCCMCGSSRAQNLSVIDDRLACNSERKTANERPWRVKNQLVLHKYLNIVAMVFTGRFFPSLKATIWRLRDRSCIPHPIINLVCTSSWCSWFWISLEA